MWAIVTRNWGWDAVDVARAHPTTIALLERGSAADDCAALDRDVESVAIDAVIDACLRIMEQTPVDDRIETALAERDLTGPPRTLRVVE